VNCWCICKVHFARFVIATLFDEYTLQSSCVSDCSNSGCTVLLIDPIKPWQVVVGYDATYPSLPYLFSLLLLLSLFSAPFLFLLIPTRSLGFLHSLLRAPGQRPQWTEVRGITPPPPEEFNNFVYPLVHFDDDPGLSSFHFVQKTRYWYVHVSAERNHADCRCCRAVSCYHWRWQKQSCVHCV